MSALLASIRTVERVMAARSVVPLTLVVVALGVHLALEVDRSRAASLGVELESDVLPAAADFTQSFAAEVAQRFGSTVLSGTASGTATETTVSTDSLVAGDVDAISTTDDALTRFSAAFDSLHTASESIADSASNLAPCATPTCGAEAVRAQLSIFRTATDAIVAVRAVTQIQVIVPRTLTAAFIDACSPLQSGRLLTRFGASYVEALANAYLELTTVHALFHRSQSLNAESAREVEATRAVETFVAARASLRYLLSFADIEALGRADPLLFADIVASAESALSDADALIPVTAANSSPLLAASFVMSLADLSNLNGLINSALDVAQEPVPNTNRKERNGLWVAVGVTAVVLICLILTIVVTSSHIRTSSAETSLMAQFSNPESTRELGQAFHPVLVGLRVDLIVNAMAASPHAKSAGAAESGSKNTSSSTGKNKSSTDTASMPTAPYAETSPELASIYAAASRMICEIRPFLPQTLFGTVVDDGHAIDPTKEKSPNGGGSGANAAQHGSGALSNPTLAAAEAAANNTMLGGVLRKISAPVPWRPCEHSIRLESTVCSTRCTLLTVVPLQPNRDVMADPDATLVWFNSVLATTVVLVNEAGGSIHAVENNGIIVCMWNVTQRTSNASGVALRVSRALVACFEGIDLNIVTGQCMVANAKTGRRRNVVVVGSALEFSERVLMLNRLHNSSIVMDFDSYRDLSLEEQSQCRPIALLHTTPTSRVVLYSADTQHGGAFTVQRRKAYLAAFALYQNGMYEDSLDHFTHYIRTYGDDSPAEWIVSHLLSHKLKPIQTIADAARVNAADRGDAVENFENLRVWGGG